MHGLSHLTYRKQKSSLQKLEELQAGERNVGMRQLKTRSGRHKELKALNVVNAVDVVLKVTTAPHVIEQYRITIYSVYASYFSEFFLTLALFHVKLCFFKTNYVLCTVHVSNIYLVLCKFLVYR